MLICPPFTLIARFAEGPFAIGGQDCHWEPSGAHTGDIAAEMLADAGAVAVIVGHSERRVDHGETDAIVALKAAAAWRAGPQAIVCVGESRGRARRRRDPRPRRRAARRLDPGRRDRRSASPSPTSRSGRSAPAAPRRSSEIAEVHALMRNILARRFGARSAAAIRLLYGGSVKPGNAAEIFAVENVDGALVGGASLTAPTSAAIIAAAG